MLPKAGRKFYRRFVFCVQILFLFFVSFSFIGCDKRQDAKYPFQLGDDQRFWVRVLLFDNFKQCTIAQSAGFTVIDGESEIEAHFPAKSGEVKIKVSDGRITAGSFRFGNEITLKPDDDSGMSIDKTAYRGNFVISLNDQGDSFRVRNIVNIEAYLAGVVGAEMPSYWEKQALQVQAVAARTYCLYIKKRYGQKRSYDVKATQSHQVYLGIKAETATVKDAVEATKGQVLIGKNNAGKIEIFPAFYSSVCGGFTDSSKAVFGEGFEPLEGVKCSYCKKTSKRAFYSWKPVEFSAKEVSDKLMSNYSSLKDFKSIVKIEPRIVSKHGRITSFTLIGQDNKKSVVRGEDLRLTIDRTGRKLKSTFCKIEKRNGKYRFYNGKGFGHGVGMCQYGVEGMARKGKGYEKILKHYYPGAKIKNIYE